MDSKQIAIEIRTAIKRGDAARVASLIENNSEVRDLLTPFGTWLHVAASRGQLEIVRFLVSQGADPNVRGGIMGGSPLNEAAAEGHFAVIEFLLGSGAQLDTSRSEWNPLFAAIIGGHVETVRFLIARGIDIRVKYTGTSMKNMDALAFAKERGQEEIAALLQKVLDRS